MKPRLMFMAGSLAGLLVLVTILGGSDSARAQTFSPDLAIQIAIPEPEAISGFTADFNLAEGDVNFAGVVAFLPGEWGIVPGDEIPIGAMVGELTSQATLGLINAACNTVLTVEFTFLNASIDPTDTVSFVDTDSEEDEGFDKPDFAEDKDNSGLPDAFEKYPDFITRVLVDEDDQPLTPIRRAAGITIVAGISVLLQFLVFEPGTFINENIPNDESLGYPTVTLLQNAGDPDFDPLPGPITDFCTLLTTSNISLGVSKDNLCTDDTPVDELDPVCTTTGALLSQCADFRDNDGDELTNDGCPTVGDEAETNCEGKDDDDGDGWINDGCPADGGAEETASSNPDETGTTLYVNPQDGKYTYTIIAVGLRDADGDGIENLLDTCAFDANQGNPRVGGDGDFDQDGLDTACDPNDSEVNSDQDLDGYLNRGDNCPLEANGEDEDNQRDTDNDQIGDACDPNPDDAEAQGVLSFGESTANITIGTGSGEGGPPSADACPNCFRIGGDGSSSGDDDGGGAAIFIIIAVIGAVVVAGGGAFYFMRRRGGGGSPA